MYYDIVRKKLSRSNRVAFNGYLIIKEKQRIWNLWPKLAWDHLKNWQTVRKDRMNFYWTFVFSLHPLFVSIQAMVKIYFWPIGTFPSSKFFLILYVKPTNEEICCLFSKNLWWRDLVYYIITHELELVFSVIFTHYSRVHLVWQSFVRCLR